MALIEININRNKTPENLSGAKATEQTTKGTPTSTYSNAFDGNEFFRLAQYLNDPNNYFDINSNETIRKAVNECPQVSTIIFRRAANQANGITTITTLDDKPIRGERGRAWQRVIDNPHPLQNRRQYVMLRDIFLASYGWCFEYKERSAEFGDMYMTRRILNPEFCDITWRQMTFFDIVSQNDLIAKFVYTENGIAHNIDDIENLYCYVNPNILARNKGFLPESPLKTLKYPINNSIVNYKTRNRLIKKPFGFVSPDKGDDISAIPLTPLEREEMSNAYKLNYGTENEWQDDLVFGPTKLAFTPLMPPIKDMQLLEMLKSDSAVICDRMGYEYDLLARDLGGVALNNKNEAGKNQYQNHEIPHAANLDEQEMESLGLFMEGIKLKTSFDHLPVLQDDMKLKSETLRNNVSALFTAFTTNQCSYDDMVREGRIAEPNSRFRGKWWCDLTPEEKSLFELPKNNTNGTQQTNDQGNQGNNQGQGANNQI